MKIMLKQDTQDCVSNVGWDGSVLYYNKKDKIVKYSGANTPLFYIKDDDLKTILGSSGGSLLK